MPASTSGVKPRIKLVQRLAYNPLSHSSYAQKLSYTYGAVPRVTGLQG